jgi:Tfp pilus assembly protein PilP
MPEETDARGESYRNIHYNSCESSSVLRVTLLPENKRVIGQYSQRKSTNPYGVTSAQQREEYSEKHRAPNKEYKHAALSNYSLENISKIEDKYSVHGEMHNASMEKLRRKHL